MLEGEGQLRGFDIVVLEADSAPFIVIDTCLYLMHLFHASLYYKHIHIFERVFSIKSDMSIHLCVLFEKEDGETKVTD